MTRELSPLRALIVDDEQRARRHLARMLSAWPSLELCAEASGGKQAVALIDELAPELVFLDLQMPDLDGFGVLRELARPPRYVVFTTAYDRFALEAFAVGALDYLLKPFGERELARAISRALEREAEARFQEGYRRLLAALERPRHLESLPVTQLQNILLLPVGEIDCFEADSGLEMVTVRTGGKAYSTELTLAELEQRLDPTRFFRAHRRAIVNVGKLLRLEPLEGGRYTAVLSDGERVEVSRSASRKLRERLGL
jgi:two-component system LytT family response regulator